MRYKATPAVRAALGPDGIKRFLRFFLKDEIDFGSSVRTDQDGIPHAVKPVYTIKHRSGQVLCVFPVDDGDKLLLLAWENEIPAIDGLHDYGNEFSDE